MKEFQIDIEKNRQWAQEVIGGMKKDGRYCSKHCWTEGDGVCFGSSEADPSRPLAINVRQGLYCFDLNQWMIKEQPEDCPLESESESFSFFIREK